MDSEAMEWQKETENAVRFMRQQGVPGVLVSRVHSYFDYIW